MIEYLYFTNSTTTDNQTILNNVIDKILAIIKTYDPNMRPSSIEKSRKVINNVLFNACRTKDKKKKTLKFTLDRSFFSKKHVLNGEEHKLPFALDIFKKVTSIMEAEGYINITIGGDFKYHEHIGQDGVIYNIVDGRKSSVMEINSCLLDLIEGVSMKKNMNDYNLLILRDEEKNDVPFEMTEVLKLQKKLLLAYNEFLETVEFRDKNGNIIDEPFLRRIYNVDLEHGGRFYTSRGVVQNMSKRDRLSITIGGEPSAEVDIHASHPTLAYTLAGECMDLDPYNFEVKCDIDYKAIENFKREFNLPEYDPLRNIKKKITLLAFTTDPHKLSFAISKKLGDDKFVQMAKDPEKRQHAEFVGLSFVQVVVGIEAMKNHNHKIRHLFNKGCYQNYEGQLMHNVLNYCLQHNLPAIPVHDSVVCQRSKTDLVQDIMNRAFTDTFGNNRNLKLKVTSL